MQCGLHKQKFGVTSATQLRWLTIKFGTLKKCINVSMTKCLHEMSNMIYNLKDVGHILNDKQQEQTVICSLLNTWEHTKVQMTQNEIIIAFDDISYHLELEEKCLEVSKATEEAFVV